MKFLNHPTILRGKTLTIQEVGSLVVLAVRQDRGVSQLQVQHSLLQADDPDPNAYDSPSILTRFSAPEIQTLALNSQKSLRIMKDGGTGASFSNDIQKSQRLSSGGMTPWSLWIPCGFLARWKSQLIQGYRCGRGPAQA